MPSRPRSDEDLRADVAAWVQAGKDQTAAARALGVPRCTFQSRLKSAARRGLVPASPPEAAAPPPGFEIMRRNIRLDQDGGVLGQTIFTQLEPGERFEPRPGHIIKSESAFVDPEGMIRGKWIKTREGVNHTDILATLRDGWADLVSGHQTIPAPPHDNNERLLLLPWGDWHLGMFAWHRETSQNWDLKIAERIIEQAAREVIDRSPPAKVCVFLWGGDILHSDSNRNRTENSGHSLDVDGRHDKVLRVAQRLLVRIMAYALNKYETVIVRMLKGNHDEYSTSAIAYFLEAWFREEPRIFVDTDPSLYWWYRFGKVLLGATHGHTVKIDQMPMIMAHRRAEDWGATKFRYIHGFHLHHKRLLATEGMGCVCEVHQAPVPQDAWHFGSGFLSGRSLRSIVYDASYGEVGSERVALLDAEEIQ